MDPIAEIAEALSSMEGSRILDVGRGKKAPTRVLSVRSASVTRVNPNLRSVTSAREAAPRASFVAGNPESGDGVRAMTTPIPGKA